MIECNYGSFFNVSINEYNKNKTVIEDNTKKELKFWVFSSSRDAATPCYAPTVIKLSLGVAVNLSPCGRGRRALCGG